MHYDVLEKLQNARAAIEDMQSAADYIRFKRAFNECLSAVKSIAYKLEGETKHFLRKSGRKHEIPDFQGWWKEQQQKVASDPLLEWAGRVRDSDTHIRNGEIFASSYSIDMLDGADLEPGPPGASLGIDSTGTYWIVDGGTVRERRIPARPRAGSPSAQARNVTNVWVHDPPTSHRGEPLVSRDAITLVTLVVNYWESFADDLFKRWWETSS